MIQWWQILLLTLYAAYQILDELTIVSSAGSPVFAGLISGLVMGDLATGLYIGGSLQLVVLGVGTFGGASRIDANSGTVLATAFAVASNMDPEEAIALIAVPVAALLVQLDILGRFANTFFAHRIDKHVENFNYKAIERDYLLGALPWALSRAFPVFLALLLGGPFVESLTTYIKENLDWLSKGLTTAGAALPGVGFAILLRYLPVKKHFAYLALGFTITAVLTTLFGYAGTLSDGIGKLFGAFGKVGSAEAVEALGSFGAKINGLPMLAIAIIGFALAAIHFKRSLQSATSTTISTVSEGEIDDDEI